MKYFVLKFAVSGKDGSSPDYMTSAFYLGPIEINGMFKHDLFYSTKKLKRMLYS